MVVLFFIIVIFFIGKYTIIDFKLGYLIILCIKLLVPNIIRFQLGPVGVTLPDICSMFLLISFFIHKQELCNGIVYPNLLKKYFKAEVYITIFLIILSTGFVPYTYQLSMFIKYVFRDLLFVWFSFWAFFRSDKQFIFNTLYLVLTIAGVYGIITYMIGSNPYINTLTQEFGGKNLVYNEFFAEERGGLSGRISGTTIHPLAWGQFWGLFLTLLFLVKSYINDGLIRCFVPICIINIILTGSRTAIVSILFFLFFYLLSFGFKKGIKKICVMSFFLFCFLTIFSENRYVKNVLPYVKSAIFFWNPEYSDEIGINGSNVGMRILQFQTALELGCTNPIGGLGYEYQMYVADHPSKADSRLFGLESVIFKRAVEQGIIGIFCFFFTLTFILKYLMMGVSDRERYLVLGYFFSFIVSICMTGSQSISWTLFLILIVLYKSESRNVSYKKM